MIHKAASLLPNHVQITFELPACIWADRIFLVGDFNAWDEKATPMHQDRDGVWRASLELPYGSRCEFRYLIDGQWKTDYHADGFTANAYGSDNSVVEATLPNEVRVLTRANSLVWEIPAPDCHASAGKTSASSGMHHHAPEVTYAPATGAAVINQPGPRTQHPAVRSSTN